MIKSVRTKCGQGKKVGSALAAESFSTERNQWRKINNKKQKEGRILGEYDIKKPPSRDECTKKMWAKYIE